MCSLCYAPPLLLATHPYNLCTRNATYNLHTPTSQDLNRAAIVKLLDSCLVTEEEEEAEGAAGGGSGVRRSAEEWLQLDPLFGPDA